MDCKKNKLENYMSINNVKLLNISLNILQISLCLENYKISKL